METFWVLTYLDVNGEIRKDRYGNEDAAQAAWLNTKRTLFLDHVIRYESSI
jgi:hypothetical protein